MTQAELDRELSHLTGESVATIRNLGFSLVDVPDHKPLLIDGETLEAERGILLFPVRPRPLAAA
jgi:hypothetical protein